MFCTAVSLLSALALSAGDPNSPNPSRATAEEHALKGQAYFKDGRLAEAEREFLAAAAADPSWHDIDYNLAVTFEALSQFEQAAQALKRYVPYAAPAELDTLKAHLAQLQIKADDQRQAAEAARAAQLKAERDAADARQRAAQQAETDRRAGEAQQAQRLKQELQDYENAVSAGADRRRAGFVTMGVGAVVAALGVVFYFLGSGEQSAITKGGFPTGGAISSAATTGNAELGGAIAAFSLGGAGVLIGGVLALTGGKPDAPAGVTFAPTKNGGLVGISGVW